MAARRELAKLTFSSVIRKHSAIRGCYGVSLETPDAQRDSDLPDVRLETRDSPIDATLYLHGVRGVPANEATRRARIDVRTASTVRLRVQRDEGVSVDAIVATTKSESLAPMPYVYSECPVRSVEAHSLVSGRHCETAAGRAHLRPFHTQRLTPYRPDLPLATERL